jgi:hypothetical protein
MGNVTEEQFAQFGLTFGVTAFMLYMLFILLQLARESKAGTLRHLRHPAGPRPGHDGFRRQVHHQVVSRQVMPGG